MSVKQHTESLKPGTELRVTRCENLVGENRDTTNRDGHYLTIENSFDVDLARLLTNKLTAGDVFRPGEAVDVEHKHGGYIGRFRLDQTQDDVANGCALIYLPPTPTKTSGGLVPMAFLHNQGGDGGLFISADVNEANGNIYFTVPGYGDKGSADGHGSPFGIEFYEDHLRLLVWPDINEEDPQIIDLEPARESNRKD